jgi:hypothetical protein
MVGVISSVFIALGLIPPYFELWKRQGRVIGIGKRRQGPTSEIAQLRITQQISFS